MKAKNSKATFSGIRQQSENENFNPYVHRPMNWLGDVAGIELDTHNDHVVSNHRRRLPQLLHDHDDLSFWCGKHMVLISEVSTADTDDDSHGTSKRAQTYFSSRVQSDDDLDGMHQIGNDQDDLLLWSKQSHMNTMVRIGGVITKRSGVFPPIAAGETTYRNFHKLTLQEGPGIVPAGRLPRNKEDVVEPNTAEMLATFVVDNHFKSQDVHPCLEILPQELPKKYITFAKLNISPRLDDLKMVKDELLETYAELQRKSSSFRKYVTFKKNYNDLLLYILCELVQNALLSEEIVTGFASGLTYLDVKVDNLCNKETCERLIGETKLTLHRE
ncbi:hypothetical protein JHK82_048446 [Glycine max]|nr:hypothetical protein JHK82_048446 [Glycine max]